MKILSAIRKLLIRDAVADTAAGYTEYFKNDPDSAYRVYSDMDVIFTVLTYGEVLNRASAQTGLADFSREGYAFKEWNTQPDGSGTSYHGGETISNGTTLYAIWVEKTDVVALNHEGAKILYDDLRGHIDEKVDLPGVYDYKSAVPADVVEIYDAVPEKIKQMQIEIAPVQDLHGYDKPWVGGGGKNLLSEDSFSLERTNKRTQTLQVEPILAGTYKISWEYSGTATACAIGFRKTAGGSNIAYLNPVYTQSPATIEFTDTVNYLYCYLPESQAEGVTIDVTKMMICASTETNFDYEPYSNICPISGFTGCEVVRTGKNLFDTSESEDGTLDDAGNPVSSSLTKRTGFIRVTPNTVYTYSGTKVQSTNGVRVHGYDANKNGDSLSEYNETDQNFRFTFKTPSDCHYIRVTYREGFTNVQIEKGSAITEYEPFAGEQYSITFPSGQTVYGGTLTVNADGTGTLVVDKASTTIENNNNWTAQEGNGHYRYTGYNLTGIKQVASTETFNGKCNMYQAKSANETYVGNQGISVQGSSERIYIYDARFDASDKLNDFKTYLNENDLQVVYELATATTIPLTAPQIRTILGYNCIYANTGSILSMLYPAERYQTAEQADKERIHAVVDEPSAVVSITDGAYNVPMGMQIAIEPVQDLHGYEYPWVGGTKNLYGATLDEVKTLNTNGTWSNNQYTYNGVTFTVNVDANGYVSSISTSGMASAVASCVVSKAVLTQGVEYTVTGCPSGGSSSTYELMATHQFIQGGQSIAHDYGSGATYTADANRTSGVQVVIRSGQNSSGLVFYPMIRLSSITDGTWMPYSNICPITGWTGAEITRTGKNLATTEMEKKGWIISNNGETTSNATNYFISKPIKIKSGVDYYESYRIVSGSDTLRIGYYTNDLQFISRQAASSGTKLVIPTNAKYMKYSAKWNEPDQVDIQIEEGSATEYEPYTGQTYTITFPDSAGTVYGGTLTVNKDGTGTLIVDKGFTTRNMIYGLLNGVPYLKISEEFLKSNKAICDALSLQEDASYTLITNGHFGIIGGNPDVIWLKINDSLTTVEEYNAYLSTNPLHFVFELLNPLTISLTAPVIRSLLGNNVVWTDTGKILSIDYVEDTKTYIDNLFASLTNATGQTF